MNEFSAPPGSLNLSLQDEGYATFSILNPTESGCKKIQVVAERIVGLRYLDRISQASPWSDSKERLNGYQRSKTRKIACFSPPTRRTEQGVGEEETDLLGRDVNDCILISLKNYLWQHKSWNVKLQILPSE